MSQPRILITRSPHQASELAERLRALDLEPILIPSIEIADPTSFAPLDAALGRLVTASPPAFHWLLFTSANAVEAFHRRLIDLPGNRAPNLPTPNQESPTPRHRVPPRQHRVPHLRDGLIVAKVGELPQNPRIAAIGPATAGALEAIGLHPSLVPPQAVAESLAEALLPHARQPDGSPTRLLLIRAEAARDHLPDALRAAGADVIIAPAYRTVVPADSVAQIKELFSGSEKWPDAITFTSSSTATNLHALFEASGILPPLEILRISIGPITSQTLRDLGLPPQAEAEQPTVAGLAAAVARALNSKNRP